MQILLASAMIPRNGGCDGAVSLSNIFASESFIGYVGKPSYKFGFVAGAEAE